MTQVFISYSRRDLAFVERLVGDLKKTNLDVWYDLSGLEGGSRWRAEIENAIRNSQYVIVVLSPGSIESEWVEREFLFASNLKRKIIPLLYKQCELPMNYLNMNFINVQGKNYRQNFGEILEALSTKPVSGSLSPVTQTALPKTGWIAAGIVSFIVLILAAVFALPRLTEKSAPIPVVTNTENSKTFTPIPASETPTLTSTPTQVLTVTPTVLPTEITDDKGVEMVLVPAGEFTMGSNNGSSDEQPVHPVNLAAFYMDKYEVTNKLYKSCVDAGICQPLQNKGSATQDRYYGNPAYDDFPVIYVDWNMSQSYCEWRGTRLPTEAEWEKAALGDSNFTYPWGKVVDCDHANYGKCIGDVTSVKVYDIGKSMYGIYNMAGNVMEWVNDWHSDTYYQYSPTDNPQGPDNGKKKVSRGGSWADSNSEVRSANRFAEAPTNLNHYVGFRCARDATP